MPIIAWDDNDAERLGIPPERRTARLIDANGLEWRSVTWCNTDTGELQHTDNAGIRHTEKTAPPIKVEWGW